MTFQEDEEYILNVVLDTIENYCGNHIGLKRQINTKLIFEGLIIDFESRLVRRNDMEIQLTYYEFEILSLLAKNPGNVSNKLPV